MVIDSHAHVQLPPERQLRQMREAGIDKTVLFTTTMHPEKAASLDEFATELEKLYAILNGEKNPIVERRQAIAELAAVIKAQPEKYLGFGSILLGLSYQENLDWIETYILANKFKGIGELTPGTGQVAQLEPLFLAARETGSMPLWVHTFFPLQLSDIRALLALAKKYPEIPVIFGHIGGLHWLDLLRSITELPNVYLDLSAAYTTIALEFAIREFPERTLFSSDAPYSVPGVAKLVIESLVTDRLVLEQVLGGNIARLLKL